MQPHSQQQPHSHSQQHPHSDTSMNETMVKLFIDRAGPALLGLLKEYGASIDIPTEVYPITLECKRGTHKGKLANVTFKLVDHDFKSRLPRDDDFANAVGYFKYAMNIAYVTYVKSVLNPSDQKIFFDIEPVWDESTKSWKLSSCPQDTRIYRELLKKYIQDGTHMSAELKAELKIDLDKIRETIENPEYLAKVREWNESISTKKRIGVFLQYTDKITMGKGIFDH